MGRLIYDDEEKIRMREGTVLGTVLTFWREHSATLKHARKRLRGISRSYFKLTRPKDVPLIGS